ncbi:MAG: 2-succinyl-6-hydroxy-2,4-cyclohexadiene-1-carboxylate synthase [Deltaproteobacteria bacterium]|nr:2-succinyl-6-hydroxy-2,4-cyclohexadiene-1-carboxylate synthase [Deltaproteobacteria bacterium]
MNLYVDADTGIGRAEKPVIFLHGFTQDGSAWEAVRQNLREFMPGVKTAAVDLMGHGASPAPADHSMYTMESCSRQLESVLRKLHLGKAWWVGYSLGGRAALYLALHNPRLVAGLALLSANPGITDEEERKARWNSDLEMADRIEQDGVPSFIDHWLGLPVFTGLRNLSQKDFDAVRARRLKNRALGLANSLRGMGAGRMEPMWNRLGELEMPVLAMAGEIDGKYTQQTALLADILPRVITRIVPGAGHSLNIEAPGEVARALLDWLTQ